ALFHLLLVLLLFPPLAIVSAEVVNLASLVFDSGSDNAPSSWPPLRSGVFSRMEQMYQEMARQPWWLILLTGCLMPGLGEPVFCRGFLGRGLVARYGSVVGVLLTSLLFGLLHIDPVRICVTAVAGVALHVVYLTTRSLWAPILLHTGHNALVFASLRLA